MTQPSFGAIFDWDGVVVDSSEAHRQSWDLLAAEEQRRLPDGFFMKSFGMKNEKIIPELLRWASDPTEITRLGNRKEELYREIIRRNGVRQIPGTRELLEALREAGIPCAIGSSTPRANIECVLEITRERHFFQQIVAAADVVHGKPAPDIFLLAAQRLGLEPSRCIVFEDAHVGIEAARSGGMKVVAVATTHPASTLQDADHVVGSMTAITLDRLRGLINS